MVQNIQYDPIPPLPKALLEIPQPNEKPITGKTYSLFGNAETSDLYFQWIEKLADRLLQQIELVELISLIHQTSSRKQFLKKAAKSSEKNGFISEILRLFEETFSEFIPGVEGHLETLSIFKNWDRRLGTTREQYFLFMLEIELQNRLNRGSFLKCDTKVAFLPHCLHDLNRTCMAKHEGLDYICKNCSKNCWLNHATITLRKNNIQPYIWMNANLGSLFRSLRRKGKSLGVLGIACIPELMNGLRLCMKFKIPAIGIPLNANRCIRWMGDFYPNSINLFRLESLVRPAKNI